MPQKKQVSMAEMKVGILVTVALLLLAALILQQSWGVDWLTRSVKAITYLPDVGGLKLARAYGKQLNADLVFIDKRRPAHNVAEVMNIVGDCRNKNVLIVDDMIDTGGTFVNAVGALKKNGARRVFGACTHPILSGSAIQRIMSSPLEKLFVTDTVQMREKFDRIEVISVAKLFAEAIMRANRNQSISSLFDVNKG